MPLSDWKFAGRQGVCCATGREFSEGEPVFSLLAVEEGTLARRDFSREAWSELEEGARPAGAVWWRTRHREGRAARKLDLGSIEGLFGALEAAEEQLLVELRFLLALVLLRKRRLKLVRSRREEGQEWLVLRRPRQEEELSVAVHELTAERRADLRDVMERLFEGADAAELVAVAATPVAVDAGPSPDRDGEAESAEPVAE